MLVPDGEPVKTILAGNRVRSRAEWDDGNACTSPDVCVQGVRTQDCGSKLLIDGTDSVQMGQRQQPSLTRKPRAPSPTPRPVPFVDCRLSCNHSNARASRITNCD